MITHLLVFRQLTIGALTAWSHQLCRILALLQDLLVLGTSVLEPNFHLKEEKEGDKY